ncbi:MAG: SLC13/DASS family transporter [Calditrichae bacterium]|nr:SLC13/DASS family transporter [Calditrichota bacterium]MCB9059697.1 SLC13/DASS family transporter [Calditrichia bacterium]
MNFKKLFIAILIPLLVLIIPTEWIPIHNLTLIEHRVIAIFILATLFWILEPIPIFATSMLIITLELFMISDNSIAFLRSGAGTEGFGTLLSYKAIMATLASPIIILFLGGFFLAAAATKYRLDVNLARVLLKPFGSSPKTMMMGLMIITAIFSMFMSNTATTAMMLAILAPVLAMFERDDPARVAFLLAIPFAANIGGIGTPIGTPPNAVAMKYLTGDAFISFGAWMAFAIPYVVILLIFAWLLLLLLFKPKATELKLEIKSSFMRSPKALTVYITFAFTILMWIFSDLHGISSYVVAMIPVAVFLVSGILNAEDVRKLSWDVLWLIAGGIALGMAMENTGLSSHLIESIPFGQFNPLIIVFMATLVAILMATFMSHTATANLLLPVMAALGTNLESLAALGGSKMIILGVTFSCSIAMSLPISTPPNAMAYASGQIQNKDMMRSGIIIGVVALGMLYILLSILKTIDFI